MAKGLHFIVSAFAALALTTGLLILVAVLVIASGLPNSFSTAMRSDADQTVRSAITEAKAAMLLFYAIICPVIAVAVGWLSGIRERRSWAVAASGVGVLPLAASVMFTGSLRAWAIVASCLYVILSCLTGAIVSRRRAV